MRSIKQLAVRAMEDQTANLSVAVDVTAVERAWDLSNAFAIIAIIQDMLVKRLCAIHVVNTVHV